MKVCKHLGCTAFGVGWASPIAGVILSLVALNTKDKSKEEYKTLNIFALIYSIAFWSLYFLF